jgi:enolase
MAATTIESISARPIFDGAARPSLEVLVKTEAATVRAAPSYSDPRSSGKYEIVHFPKGGVPRSIEIINTQIRELLVGMDASDQADIDHCLEDLDGTPDFSVVGGNTIEAISMAVAKAAAASLEIPLFKHASIDGGYGVPHIMPNIIGGGATMGDTGWKGRCPDIQDHIIVPIGCKTFIEEMARVCDVFHRTGKILQEVDPGFSGGRDEEYCWLPGVDDVTSLEILEQACNDVSQAHGISFRLGLDVGAADLWNEDEGVYQYALEGRSRTPSEQSKHIGDLIERFDLFYVEDAFFEDHVDMYVEQTLQFGDRVLIAGDDLLAGSLSRLQAMAERNAINAAVIKLNMAGSVSRCREFVRQCKGSGFATIGSCRTYDSPDDTLADLVAGWGCASYKCGSPAGGEHAAKQNRFIRIDEEIGPGKGFSDISELVLG